MRKHVGDSGMKYGYASQVVCFFCGWPRISKGVVNGMAFTEFPGIALSVDA